MKRVLVKIFAKLGLKKIALKIFNRVSKKSISLKDMKYIVHLSSSFNDDKLLEKYINLAIELFPNNSYGYIESANLEIRNQNYSKAYAIINQSPTTKETSKLKKILISKDIGQNDFENEITKIDGFKEKESHIKNTINADPFNKQLYVVLFDLYSSFKRNDKIAALLRKIPISSLGSASLAIIFKKSELYQSSGDYSSSLSTLLDAQKNYTGDRRVLFKIAEIYKFDNQIQRAYIMLKAGELDYPTYGAVRRLSFEVDNLLLDNAQETLGRILNYNISDLSRYMTMINRVSAYLPEYSDVLMTVRIDVEKKLREDIFRDEVVFNKNLEYLLGGRYLKDLDILIDGAAQKNINLYANTLNWIDKVKNFLEMDKKSSFLGWIEVANKNESLDVLFGIDNGIPVEIEDTTQLDKKSIEIFIPNSIFTNPKNDKSSFENVSSMFKEIFLFLLSRDDIVIIPRHQYNWRYGVPRSNAKVISYHTSSDNNNLDWLHVQESTLSGYCSVDTQGFAGYASIAYDFKEIEKKIANISLERLHEEYENLYEKYIKNNISKYKQEEITFDDDGQYIFVALQVLTDVVANLADINGIDLVKNVANIYRDSGIKVVVKRHPYCNSISMQRMVTELEKEGLIELSNASIHSIIKGANAIFTVNSGVGLESLMHLKPVIISGSADYAYAVHSHVKSIAELETVIQDNNFSIDKNKILKFLYFYTKFYVQDKKSIKGVLEKWLK